MFWAGGFRGSAFRIAPSVGRLFVAAGDGAKRLVCDDSDLAGVRSDDAKTKCLLVLLLEMKRLNCFSFKFYLHLLPNGFVHLC
jgi:hypothetical protein